MIDIGKEILTLLALIAVPVLRGVGGWLQNALKDGVIEVIEWRELGVTVIRVGLIAVAVYYGLDGLLNGLGMPADIPALAAGFAAFIIDKIIEAIKDLKNIF